MNKTDKTDNAEVKSPHLELLWKALHEAEQSVPFPPNLGYQIALSPQNFYKNRYGNVLPTPETRVRLDNKLELSNGKVVQLEDNEIGEGYINANWIQGEEKTRYIACQAPLPNTFTDFWHMIFQYRAGVIVMLTRLQENGKVKAHTYWPYELGMPFQFGNLSVTLIEQFQHSTELTIRQFAVKHPLETTLHYVTQVHYIGWPDFGVPTSVHQVMQLLKIVDFYFQSHEKKRPIVVHCSAGLGRTGTLIGSHIVLERFRLGKVKDAQEINLADLVAELREQRRGLIQNFEQFELLEKIICEIVHMNENREDEEDVYEKGGEEEEVYITDEELYDLDTESEERVEVDESESETEDDDEEEEEEEEGYDDIPQVKLEKRHLRLSKSMPYISTNTQENLSANSCASCSTDVKKDRKAGPAGVADLLFSTVV